MSPPAAFHSYQALEAAAGTLLAIMGSADGASLSSGPETSDDASASRKGQPWTEDEHRAFLAGLKKLGRGNWREISRSFVSSRTPTQVASHAQKHFMRVAGATKRKSRFTALESAATERAVIPTQSTGSGQPQQDAQQPPEQQLQQQQVAAQQCGMMAAAMPGFPFMHPMMFGFPGPFFPPFMCPPPAFAAAMSAMQKGAMPMMMPSPMFPMAMNPFFMAAAAQQMAAAAAANAHAAQAATSGGATTAGTAGPATADTANSDEAAERRPHSTPGSPGVRKPEAHHAKPAVAGSPAAAGGAGAASGEQCVSSASREQRSAASGGGRGGSEQLPRSGQRSEDGRLPFHASSHSAFRPPQEIKTEG